MIRLRVNITSINLTPEMAAAATAAGGLDAAAQRLCKLYGWPNAWIETFSNGSATISRLTPEAYAAMQQARACGLPLH